MTYITGDLHGQFDRLIEIIQYNNITKNDTIILLGDVGFNYYLNTKDYINKTRINELECTVFCVHGNHELRPQNIYTYKEKLWNGGIVFAEEEFPNLLFAKDGEIFQIENHQCLVIGGAYSVDKPFRLLMGYSWWEDEQPSKKTKQTVEEHIKNNRIDIVLTHTCPHKYMPTEMFLPNVNQDEVDKSTERWLDTIEEMINYKKWYCGHFHTNKKINKVQFLFHEVHKFNENI